jgi:hypothetical protein
MSFSSFAKATEDTSSFAKATEDTSSFAKATEDMSSFAKDFTYANASVNKTGGYALLRQGFGG